MSGPSAAHSIAREILDTVAPILVVGGEKQASAPELIAALQRCGGWRMLQPTRYGGLGVAGVEFVTTVCELAALDASLGWLTAMFNAAAHEIAGLPGEVADEVFGGDGPGLIAPGYRSEGRLAAAGGEYRLTGCWHSVAGADLADWLLLTAENADGSPRRVLLRGGQVSTEPTGTPSGLFATDICDVTVADVAIAADRIFESPVSVLAGAGAAAAVVGAADGVWQLHVREIRQRLSASYGGEDVLDRPSSTVQVGRAASDIDAAKLQLMASIEPTADPDAVRAATWAQLQAAGRARDAADDLLASSRRHALIAVDPVTRGWQGTHACFRLATWLLGT